MKKLVLFIPLLLLLASCGTTRTYKPNPNAAVQPAKPADYPIPLYNENMRIPRPCELIGQFSIGDTQLTMFGGSMKGVTKTLMETAHEKGADVVVLTSIKQPEFESAHYRLEANLLRYSDNWETVTMSESNLVAYLQQHQKSLDPIEGIWSDGSADRIGIIRNNSKPGRDFIAFMLNVELPSWQAGYRKIDIARVDRPGAYSLKYYQDDFAMVKTTFQLNQSRQFSFLIITDDKADEITLTKIGAPMPLSN
jgi:hypothetical protein